MNPAVPALQPRRVSRSSQQVEEHRASVLSSAQFAHIVNPCGQRHDAGAVRSEQCFKSACGFRAGLVGVEGEKDARLSL